MRIWWKFTRNGAIGGCEEDNCLNVRRGFGIGPNVIIIAVVRLSFGRESCNCSRLTETVVIVSSFRSIYGQFILFQEHVNLIS